MAREESDVNSIEGNSVGQDAAGGRERGAQQTADNLATPSGQASRDGRAESADCGVIRSGGRNTERKTGVAMGTRECGGDDLSPRRR